MSSDLRYAVNHTPTSETSNQFQPGTQVIYGTLGKCTVVAVQEKMIGGKPVLGYSLEPVRALNSKSIKNGTHVWIPVQGAKERGLRLPVDHQNANAVESVFLVLGSPEYYLPLNQSETKTKSDLEKISAAEGIVGLAKALSFLYVAKRRTGGTDTEINRLYEQYEKLIAREISEATGQTQAQTLAEMNKKLKTKDRLAH